MRRWLFPLLPVLLPGLLLAALWTGTARAEGDALVLASGAGYKKMVGALVTAYEAKSGRHVEQVFGNMAQVTAQAKASGAVDMVLGDESFLGAGDLDLAARIELGRGRLVIAWPKGGSWSQAKDLLAFKVRRIALPDTKSAIYGKAAKEYLQSMGLYDKVLDRLVEVATVPQVFAYLAAGEVDYGFINLTHALNVADQLGGYAVLESTAYAPIRIVVCTLQGAPHAGAAEDFARFLATPEAQAVVRANGL